jgi:hypothetical protein
VSDNLEPPHPNGAGKHSTSRRGRAPWEFIILMLFVALIGIGIILAWTLVGSHSPERLSAADGVRISTACNDAQARLKGLPNPSPITGPDRVARIRAENSILRAMVTQIAQVRPTPGTPASALHGWTTDWSNVIDARDRYATDLVTKGSAQFVLPASSGGVKPITQNMDDYVRENHPNLDACFTEALQLEVTEGPREYKKVTS